jgi:hypothetical protein
MVVVVMMMMIWVLTLCRVVGRFIRFGGTYRHHFRAEVEMMGRRGFYTYSW